MSRDIEKGIGNLMGYESPETKRVRDLYYLDKVKRIIEGPPKVQPFGPTLSEKVPHVTLRTTPSLSPSVNTKEAKVAEGPTRAESKGAYNNFVSNQKTINQLKALKEWAQPTPVGLGDKYKSDIRTPVERKRAEFKARAEANKAWIEANKPNADTSKGGYVPWFQRMADEAKEKEEEDPRTEGRMEELQKIEDKGKSWFSKHLKKSQ